MSQAVGMIMLFIHLLACHWSGHISPHIKSEHGVFLWVVGNEGGGARFEIYHKLESICRAYLTVKTFYYTMEMKGVEGEGEGGKLGSTMNVI